MFSVRLCIAEISYERENIFFSRITSFKMMLAGRQKVYYKRASFYTEKSFLESRFNCHVSETIRRFSTLSYERRFNERKDLLDLIFVGMRRRVNEM